VQLGSSPSGCSSVLPPTDGITAWMQLMLLHKCSPTSVKGSEPGDSAGPGEPQPVNDYLQQHTSQLLLVLVVLCDCLSCRVS